MSYSNNLVGWAFMDQSLRARSPPSSFYSSQSCQECSPCEHCHWLNQLGFCAETTVHEPIICARRIRKLYGTGPNTISVLKDLTFDLRPGELSLYVGPSGSGKSTLLACLSGLVRPNAGEICVLGR